MKEGKENRDHIRARMNRTTRARKTEDYIEKFLAKAFSRRCARVILAQRLLRPCDVTRVYVRSRSPGAKENKVRAPVNFHVYNSRDSEA